MHVSRIAALAAVVVLAAAGLRLSACASRGRGANLLDLPEALLEAEVAGRERAWVGTQFGRTIRINDVVRRTLPATPPSRLRFKLDIPRDARLDVSCGIPSEHHGDPGVEFVVKVRSGDREDTAWSLLVDPLRRPAHQRWVEAQIDLAKYAGRGRELILETRGFEPSADMWRAFWGTPALTTSEAATPLVVLYLVDTIRADHTTPYGYGRDTTPELTRFASDAVTFQQAISHASWTKPAVASLLTSQLPGRHRAVQLRDSLDDGQVTLAEMLRAKGYATGAAVANSVIYAEGTNFEQGFETYAGLHGADDRPSKVVEAAGVVDEALRWLDSRRSMPRFLYIHTMDPHVPYTPPPPFDRMFAPHPTPDHPAADPRSDYKEPEDRERLIAQYDGEIAYGDREFGRFLAELKKRGLYERALIVFLGDHGEEFLDHGQWTHGKSVFDELIRIPLIVKFPGNANAGRRLEQQVQVGDVLPTVLEGLDLPVPAPPDILGRPLQAGLRAAAPEPPAVSEISHRGFVAHGMRTSRDKYVQRFSPQEDELYFDLLRDPVEKANRLEEARERVRLLRAGVEAAMVPNPFRDNLRVIGPGRYELKLRTAGWFLGVEPAGFGTDERYELEGNGRKLALQVRPRPGQSRELAFSVRPMGAPVWLEGTRDGRPLRAEDILIAQDAVHPLEMPFRFPEIESEKQRVENIFSPPPGDRPGIQVWLTLAPGRTMMRNPDKETCESLKALGYVGTCP